MGKPGVIKTTNGKDWTLIPMSEYADNLIDVFFMDELNGFVVGGKNHNSCPRHQTRLHITAVSSLRPG